MNTCFASYIRQSAPVDGRDPFVNVKGENGFYTSKQNSDAHGLFYQSGHKDPFTFATSSEAWGSGEQYGKYPIKIYTIDGVLIYQDNRGANNKDKQPAGGIILSSTLATSMMETIKNPITFYGGAGIVISQVGHTNSLWDYYWTSYSRGTDGSATWGNYIELKPNFHNEYLDVYISQRSKAIYDPCPFGFKLPSNGTLNTFNLGINWIDFSYTGGTVWNCNNTKTWLSSIGYRYFDNSAFTDTGSKIYFTFAISGGSKFTYCFRVGTDRNVFYNRIDFVKSYGYSVRCIDFVNPPRPTDEISLSIQIIKKLFTPVSKTVMQMGCIINGGIKIHLYLLQIVKNQEANTEKKENILLRYIQ